MNTAGIIKGQTKKRSKLHFIALCLVFANEDKVSMCLSGLATEEMTTKSGRPWIETLIELRGKLLDAGMAEDPDFIEQWRTLKTYPTAFVDMLQDLSKQHGATYDEWWDEILEEGEDTYGKS